MVEKSASRSLAKRFQEIAPNLTDSQPSNSPSLIPLPISNLQSPNARVNPSQAPIILPASPGSETNMTSQTINNAPATQSEEHAILSVCGLQALKVNLY
jgi:hypothetical protein